MKRFLTSLALLLCAALAVSAQPPVSSDSPLKNRFDSLGRKTGYWTEESPSSIACLFYRDGLKDGLARFYNKTPVGNFLTAVGSYSDGHESGQWMHFFENGRSVAIVRDSISVSADHDLCWQVFPGVMQRGEPVLSCHAVFYDESGFIRAEGRGIYYEGPSFFETFQRTGVWIFYNPDGSSRHSSGLASGSSTTPTAPLSAADTARPTEGTPNTQTRALSNCSTNRRRIYGSRADDGMNYLHELKMRDNDIQKTK